MQTIITHFARPAQKTKSASYRAWRSEVVWNLIVGEVCCEAEGQVVIPARDLAAQVCDPLFVKPVFSKVVVSEDADPGEMVLN